MKFEYYSLVIYPNIKKEKIDEFRKKYDPLFNVMDFHITLIFPVKVPNEIKGGDLIDHINKMIKTWKPFEVTIKGLELSWDNWLFLLINKGSSDIIKIHDELYTIIMTRFLRKDIKFIPHISIGSFTKESGGYDLRDPKKLELDKKKYEKAIVEAKKIDVGYECQINRLSLIKLNNKLKNCRKIKDFVLK